jgi:putative ABC transport system permease protein
MAMLLEQERERAILRASGVTRGQLLGLVGLQTGLMGLMAGLLALPLGLAMGRVLIQVINLRSFGWSLQPLTPPGVFADAVLLALAAALLAGLLPAWRSTRIQPASALREE